MKNELTYFERFIALNFSELRRFLIAGPSSLFGKSIDRLSSQIKKLDPVKFEKTINYLKISSEEKYPQKTIESYSYFLGDKNWDNYSFKKTSSKEINEGLTDLELYKSVCVFFDLFKEEKLGVSGYLDSLMEIILGFRYADAIVTRGATTSMQDNAFNILFKYAEVDKSVLCDPNNSHKIVNFDTVKGLFLMSHISSDFKKNLKKLIQFLQDVRNSSEHEHITHEDGYEQVKMWVYSYIYIIYIIRRSLKQKGNYKDISNKYWFTIFIPDGVSVFQKNESVAINNKIEQETGRRYVKLLPFTEYRYTTTENPDKQDLILDTFCQYGTFVPPVSTANFRIMFENSILSFCANEESRDNELKEKLIEGINHIFNDQNKKWEERFGKFTSDAPTSVDIENAIREINDQTKTLIPLINANNEEFTSLKIQVNELTEIIKSAGFNVFKEEIADRIYNDPRATEWIKTFSDRLDKVVKENTEDHQLTHEQLRKLIDLVNRLLQEKPEKKKTRKVFTWIIGGVLTIIIAFVCVFLYLRFSDNIPQQLLSWADNFGNKDAAYKYAILLEGNEKFSEAADWYMKARKKYAKMLTDNPNDSIRASRLAEMSMRGKGGIINTDTAEYYAHLAKRYDLEAYLAVVNGNVYKSKEIVNSYQSTRSPYFDLADALSSLLYPKDHSAEEIELCWEIVDSLASTKNQATPEAIHCAFSICSDGVKDKNENYIVAPSLYDAITYAQDADTHYNSIYAQIYLASKFMSLHLRQDAEKYYNKAKENNVFGCEEITFSHNRINELTDDPQALVAKAHYNAQKGYTDYRMTGYYYHIADSINKVRRIYKLSMEFYKDWFDFIVNAEDIKNIDQILHLINREYPDSLRIGIAEYVMALKYSNGKGVSLDAEKSGEHLKRAASSGLEDAQVAVSILLDIDSIPEGMKNLEKLAFRNSPNPFAARYLLSKEIKKDRTIPELIKRSDDEFALLIKLNILNLQDSSRFSRETLLSIKQQINIVLSDKTDFSESAFLLGKLAEIEYLMGNRDETNFYIKLASQISPKDAYSSYFGISETARKLGDIANAAYFADRFARLYFLDNGKVLYEPERSNVVSHIYHLYPEILDLVKEKMGYDFEKNTYFFIDGNFEKDRNPMTFESPVKNLRIKLPDYVRPIVPITMKYFD